VQPWLLLFVQAGVFAVFPFAFAPLPPNRRLTLFYVYIAAVLTVAGTLGAVYSLPLTDNAILPFGGIAYSALLMSTIMMYVVTHDLEVVRNTIRLVVVLNLLIAVVLGITAAALRSPEVINPFAPSPSLFSTPIWSAIVGGLLNVGQLVLLIAIFERSKRVVRNTALLGAVYVIAFVGTLAIDGALFPTLATLAEPELADVLGTSAQGMRSKLLLGAWFSAPLIGFLVLHRQHLADHRNVVLDLRHVFIAPSDEVAAELARRQEDVERQAGLLRMAGRLAQVGGFAVDVATERVWLSEEVFEILEVSKKAAPTLEEALTTWPSAYRERIMAAYRSCASEGIPFDLEAETATGSGRWIWVRAVGEAERAVDGSIARVVAALVDITANKEAAARTEELARQLTTTMESITDAIGTLDRRWCITYVNPRAEELLGASGEQLVGRRIGELYPEGLGSGFDRTYRRAMRDGTPDVVVDWWAPAERWIEANVYPSNDGLTIYFRDVTDRIERERMLQQIADREQQAAEQLRHLNQVKDSFLTAVSHELRTPLTVVQGMATTLQRLRSSDDLGRREQIEDALAENADRLGSLLTDLLDVDRLSRGVLTAEPVRFDVAELAAVTIARSDGASHTILEAPTSLHVLADPIRCERILVNLLDNAGKYAPDGTVTVRLAGLPDGGLRLEVRDQGPGIPESELTAVFEPFHRVQHDHPQPGTGVGLALVAEFAGIHGGRAWAEPTAGDGAHIVVELPGEGSDELGAAPSGTDAPPELPASG
jgi:PAS domain S-box-containing protein